VSGQRIGYVRVSSFDQNPERQLEAVLVDRTFIDKASGKDTLRPQLEELLAFVRHGDTVVVHSMDRLAHFDQNATKGVVGPFDLPTFKGSDRLAVLVVHDIRGFLDGLLGCLQGFE
jgi:hypothetical protein